MNAHPIAVSALLQVASNVFVTFARYTPVRYLLDSLRASLCIMGAVCLIFRNG